MSHMAGSYEVTISTAAHVRWVLKPGRQFISRAAEAPGGKSGQAESKNPSDILINPTTQAKTRSHPHHPWG